MQHIIDQMYLELEKNPSDLATRGMLYDLLCEYPKYYRLRMLQEYMRDNSFYPAKSSEYGSINISGPKSLPYGSYTLHHSGLYHCICLFSNTTPDETYYISVGTNLQAAEELFANAYALFYEPGYTISFYYYWNSGYSLKHVGGAREVLKHCINYHSETNDYVVTKQCISLDIVYPQSYFVFSSFEKAKKYIEKS